MPYGTVITSWHRLGENKILLFVSLPSGAHGELKLNDGWTCDGDTALCESKKFILTRK